MDQAKVYVIDTNVVSALHRNYFRGRFPTLWSRFDELVVGGRIVSTRESYRELEDHGGDAFAWASDNQPLFPSPTASEGAFVTEIFLVPHFQAVIEQQKIIKGGKNADPFLVARAAVNKGTVLTTERFKDNAAKIPNICKHFGVSCVDLQTFMEQEDWVF